MKTHACTLGTIAAMFGCLSILGGCSAASAPAPAHAPIASQPSPAASSCVVVQRGASGDVADTRIAEQWPQANYGASDASFAGKVGSGERDVLLGFPLPKLPANADDLALLLTVDTEAWKLEADQIPEFFRGFGDHLPARLLELQQDLIDRLG